MARPKTSTPSTSLRSRERILASSLPDDDKEALLDALAICEADLDIDSELVVSTFWASLRALRKLAKADGSPLAGATLESLTIHQVIAAVGVRRAPGAA